MTCELCDANVADLCQHLYDVHIQLKIASDGVRVKRCWCDEYHNCEDKNCRHCKNCSVLIHLRSFSDPVKHLLEAQLTNISKIGGE